MAHGVIGGNARFVHISLDLLKYMSPLRKQILVDRMERTYAPNWRKGFHFCR